MGEYGREQRKQESRVIANNGGGSRQLKLIADDRSTYKKIVQLKSTIKTSNMKVVQRKKYEIVINGGRTSDDEIEQLKSYGVNVLYVNRMPDSCTIGVRNVRKALTDALSQVINDGVRYYSIF